MSIIVNRIDNLPENMEDLVPHNGKSIKLKGFIQKIDTPVEDHDIEVEVGGNLTMTKNCVKFKDIVTEDEIYYTYEDYNERAKKDKQSEETSKQIKERNKQLKIRNRQLRKINKFLNKIMDEDPSENIFDKNML